MNMAEDTGENMAEGEGEDMATFILHRNRRRPEDGGLEMHGASATVVDGVLRCGPCAVQTEECEITRLPIRRARWANMAGEGLTKYDRGVWSLGPAVHPVWALRILLAGKGQLGGLLRPIPAVENPALPIPADGQVWIAESLIFGDVTVKGEALEGLIHDHLAGLTLDEEESTEFEKLARPILPEHRRSRVDFDLQNGVVITRRDLPFAEAARGREAVIVASWLGSPDAGPSLLAFPSRWAGELGLVL
jgi:hypothetical protein